MPVQAARIHIGGGDRVGLEPLIRRLERRDVLSAAEKDALSGAVCRTVEVAADRDILREHDVPSECRLLLEGWTSRYTLLAGGQPQILGLQIPGDFIDLQSFPRRRMDHAISTLTPCRLAVIPHRALHEIMDRNPHLARLLWLDTLVDGAISRRWLLNVGHRRAREAMSHLICELFTRLRTAGMTKARTCQVPVTQTELGSALGLTSVHTNRVVQELRHDGLITWRGTSLTIEDWNRLCRIAEFDPAYLDLERAPR
ncbi:Crp/Fnr family transcriptional regulator [Methylobacterium sp. NEAU K]|uniref:Crp/Fnr family transcriptional regulator n=1 Tax=Methylobacterium sp. NEAU K TaxID=3064946 RepID=UPI0027363769|nr:Crp/Fnr family transcriptional regulator [Methylobacterium sp. NEAU K]MDP4003345.1 Crp/Fnr family transcriptional regulator [Methylobacterium sp. NEAU K]